METRRISKAVIERLPRYYRYLEFLSDQKIERISSGELSKMMHLTASQIRQDLNTFGGFGMQGYGYNVDFLYTEIGKILGLERSYTMVMVGAGNLGSAIARYVNFEKRGFHITALFDADPALKDQCVRGIPILPVETMAQYLTENKVDIVALTLPSAGAADAAQIAVEHGIRAIWNFAHTDLDLPEDVVVENVHLSESLMRLSYRLNESCRVPEEEE